MSAKETSLLRIELHENLYGDGLMAAQSGRSETVAYPGILLGGVQQIMLRTEDRKKGYLGR